MRGLPLLLGVVGVVGVGYLLMKNKNGGNVGGYAPGAYVATPTGSYAAPRPGFAAGKISPAYKKRAESDCGCN